MLQKHWDVKCLGVEHCGLVERGLAKLKRERVGRREGMRAADADSGSIEFYPVTLMVTYTCRYTY